MRNKRTNLHLLIAFHFFFGKKLTDHEVYALLTLAGLDASFFSKNGYELSVGQAQRVAVARTLAYSPKMMIRNTVNWLHDCVALTRQRVRELKTILDEATAATKVD